ncbi:hypothetical protein F4Z99_06765 [Candidatus Poribacteria bacterium]|nr:hypothetical protein [Candidatus Poribacteria bacterium]MYB00701.1 hypothetical protein [Candidatus Poribacteria bacterium]
MDKILTRYNFGHSLKMSAYIAGIVLMLSIAGCVASQGQSGTGILQSRLSWLQGTPIEEITASQLTCETHPEVVDGNLETVATFAVQGTVTKKYEVVERSRRSFGRGQYITDLDGTIRCEMLIKLEKPMYVNTVEVYPASRIPNLALSTTLEVSGYHLGQSGTGFQPVHDKQHRDAEGTKPVKFSVAREVLYLRVTADAIEDRQNATRVDDKEIDIPLKGASIREIKLYGKKPS